MVHAILFNGATKYSGDFALGIYRPAGAHKFATALRERGYKVEVVDYLNYWSLEQIKQFIQKNCTNETLFIGWSTSFFNIKKNTYDELIDWIRKKYPHIKLMVGGNQPTFSNLNNLDYYVYSYAEGAIDDLLEHVKGNNSNLKAEIFNDGKSLFIDCAKNYKLDDWGNPQIIYQKNDFIRKDECLTIDLSRGCIFQCKFCSFPITNKKGVDHIRSEESLRKELQDCYDNYGTTSFIIADETVNDSIYKLETLRNAVRKLNFKPDFTGFFRADLIYRYPETIQLLKDCNVVGMHFGVETFHQKSGIAIGKGLAPNKIKETLIRVKKEFGQPLNIVASFIVGLPYEPIESIYETQEWLESTDCPLTSWIWFGLNIPNPEAKLRSSYFSNHFEKYGYESLGICPDDEKSVHWRLPHIDYYGALKMCEELTKKSAPYRRVDPWHTLAFKGLGIDRQYYSNKLYDGQDSLDYDFLLSVGKNIAHQYISDKLSTSI